MISVDDTGVVQDRSRFDFWDYVLLEIEPYDDGCRCVVVDGQRYRLDVDIDYTEGTNWMAPTGKDFVPENVIALDSRLAPDEWSFVRVHEHNEVHLMADEGWQYDPAHHDSNRKELAARRLAAATLAEALQASASAGTAADASVGRSTHGALDRYIRRVEILSL